MKLFKGILLDIDNTLYPYDPAHKIASTAVLNKISTLEHVDVEEVKIALDAAKAMNKSTLPDAASSHNRLLYFQLAIEKLGKNPLVNSLEYYDTYWSTFIANISLFEGVTAFLQQHVDKKIIFLTDLTADIQYKKIKALKLDRYVAAIVTSEEAGHEKPHPFMFMKAMRKLGLTEADVCMIGDNYKKDILGAAQLGIESFYITSEKKETPENVTKVRKFKDLLNIIP